MVNCNVWNEVFSSSYYVLAIFCVSWLPLVYSQSKKMVLIELFRFTVSTDSNAISDRSWCRSVCQFTRQSNAISSTIVLKVKKNLDWEVKQKLSKKKMTFLFLDVLQHYIFLQGMKWTNVVFLSYITPRLGTKVTTQNVFQI